MRSCIPFWIAFFASCVSSVTFAQGQGPRRRGGMPPPRSSAPQAAAAPRYLPAYGMTGCGMGSVLIRANTKGPQIGSFFVNFGFTAITSFFSPSWAMSSGSSNCTDRPSEVAMEQEVFLENNLASLSRDAARGGGERLEAFAEVMGCTDDASKQSLSRLSQENFDALFHSENPQAVLEVYVEMMRATPDLKQKCQRLG